MQKNGLKVKNKRMQLIYVLLIIISMTALLFAMVGCKNSSDKTGAINSEITAAPGNNETTAMVTEGTTAISTSETNIATTETTSEIIPQEIKDLLASAENYYQSGEYSLAEKSYRNAELAIKNSNLSESKKKDLLDGFLLNYTKTKGILESARLHFGNGMQLEYEKRFNEAKKEFEAALAVYPKYKDAIDALGLEEMTGLK